MDTPFTPGGAPAPALPTLSQQLATQENYPPQLFGFGPDDEAYWTEPGLGWVGAAAHRSEPAPLDPQLVGPLLVWNDEMAPRFLLGTRLAARPLRPGDEVRVGQVLAWYAPGTPPARFELARIHAVEAGHLLLRCDNGGRSQRLPWAPGAEPAAPRAYLVTHYVSQPFPWTRLHAVQQPAPTDEEYVLEVRDSRMGARYPAGARYRCRPVPPANWPTARGVHALRLRAGGELLARLVSQYQDDLILSFDGTDQPERVALADVAQVWKVGAALFLPEETPAEHRASLLRRGY